jgi:hypothetical protein
LPHVRLEFVGAIEVCSDNIDLPEMELKGGGDGSNHPKGFQAYDRGVSLVVVEAWYLGVVF